MPCSLPQRCEAQAPSILQGLVWEELLVPLQGPGKDHLGAMVRKSLHGECCLGVHREAQGVGVHLVGSNLQGACISQDLDVLVEALQEQLGPCCCPLRIWRQSNTTAEQELSKGQELLVHPEGLPMDSPYEAPSSIFKEDDGQLPT